MTLEKLLSAEQVSEYLGMHVKTLLKMLRENTIDLNYIKTHSRKIGFRPSAVEEFLKKREVVRDGSGTPKPSTLIPENPRLGGYYGPETMFMTDQEAQEFFKKFTRDKTGTPTI